MNAATRSDAATRGWVTFRARIAERFWNKVDSSGGPDACWPWIGARQTKIRGGRHGGYGVYTYNGKVRYAHRKALELSLGRELVPGEQALHRCDNPPCCNPAHLFAGTRSDNMQDMAAKGRRGYTGSRGERHPMARLTEDQVHEIRALYSSGVRPRFLAKQFGVTSDHASEIARGKSWAHV